VRGGEFDPREGWKFEVGNSERFWGEETAVRPKEEKIEGE